MSNQQKQDNDGTAFTISPRRAALILLWPLAALLMASCAGDYARKRAEHYYLQGQVLVNRGETERAIKKFEKSIYLSEKTGFEAGVAHNLNELAIIRTGRGEFERARSELSRALKIYRSLNLHPEVSKTLNNMVQTYIKEGRYEDAILSYEALIQWDQKTGNQLGLAIALFNMAIVYDRHMGDHIKAREARNRSLEILREPGNEKYLQQLKGN